LKVMISRRERMVMPRCLSQKSPSVSLVRPFDPISYRFLEESAPTG
jgi:hypothetical protein